MAQLLTGTVTFLFTDIEGSTRLWEQQPEAMREALTRHDDLLRQAIEAHQGRVFKTMGDQFCAVFAAAPGALAAAVAAQLALQAEACPQTRPVRLESASERCGCLEQRLRCAKRSLPFRRRATATGMIATWPPCGPRWESRRSQQPGRRDERCRWKERSPSRWKAVTPQGSHDRRYRSSAGSR